VRQCFGHRFLPVSRIWQGIAVAYLMLALVWTKSAAVAGFMGHGMWQLSELGLPFYLHAFDKTFVTLPRLLHILALAYLLSSLPWVRMAAASGAARPFALLGRNALPVFAAGTVLCFVVQAVKDATGGGFALDAVLIGGGLGLQYGLAALTERWKAPLRPRRIPNERPVGFDASLRAQPGGAMTARAEA
jgi:hypothetical protein